MKKLILFIITIILISGCSCSKEIKYTVSFDSNGGTIVEEQIVSENNYAKEPNEPTKEGYDFAGWYYDNQVFNFNTKITKDITLQARWHKKECNIICDEDEHIDISKCECTKNVFMEITSISLDKTALTLEVGKKATIKASVKPNDIPFVEIKWSSSNDNIATVDNGTVKAISVGEATITAYSGDVKTNIKVKVINSSNNIITKAMNTIKSKKITKGNTSINYSYSGCIITNTNNKVSNNKTIINDGVITTLYRSINKDTITSDYKIECNGEIDYKNGVVHEIVASPYTYEASLQDVVYIIKVENAKDYILNGDLKYRESKNGVQTGVSNFEKGTIYEMVFQNDSTTIYEVKEKK